MKKLLITFLSIAIFSATNAQKLSPEIKAGTALTANVFVQGQAYPLSLTLKTITAPVNLAWAVDNYGGGTFEMSQKAIDSGTEMFMGQPGMGASKLSDTETYGLISRAAYKNLMESKAFSYNGIKFKIKATPTAMKFGDKELDVTHVASEDGKLELWVLNNAAWPLIVQSIGLPIDFVVTAIK